MEVHEIAIVPLIVGVIELFKGLGLPNKFSALASSLLGILIGVFYLYPTDLPRGLITGLSFGLAASGLYSGTKNTMQGVRDMKFFKKDI